MRHFELRNISVLISLLLLSALCWAKGDVKASEERDVLSPLSRISLKSAEIAAYMPKQKMLFSVGDSNSLEMVNLSDPKNPAVVGEFLLDGEATSVSSYENLIAVSLLADPAWDDGFVELLQYDGAFSPDSAVASVKKIGTYKVCSHPDMITFSPDGKTLLVACEGEPSADGKIDPPGGVALVTVDDATFMDISPVVTIIPFEDVGVEPEYITVSADSRWAWVSLQENNAIARIDVLNKKMDGIFDLGYVDHSKAGFGLDAIKDGKIRIENEFFRGLRQPDGIKSFESDGRTFIVTANEGADVKKFDKTKICGHEEKCDVRFGSRSISVFDGFSGQLLWDSGDALEQEFARKYPKYFNWNSKKGKRKVDARSDDKGCEPENVVVGTVGERRLAFVGLERMSGVAVFDLTSVGGTGSPRLVEYTMDPADRGPEGMLFINEKDSPLKDQAILIVNYEYSKSLVIYTVR